MENQERILPPTTIVLLGAMGDLAQKKLLPALMDLFARNALPSRLHIIAFSRKDIDTDTYRAFARTHIERKNPAPDSATLSRFLETFEYVQGTFEDPESYERIRNSIEEHDAHIGMCSNKLFYLAVPPSHYEHIFGEIATVKLEQPCDDGNGWTRILVEKPFGNDLAHAKHLDEKLGALFREEQIYRIDHYLAKEALQNILAFRFSNVLFEGTWNKDFIDAVHIHMSERKDVSTRGAFYDTVGALRDVGQNHILQMLALIAMDRPEDLNAQALRSERSLILESLIPPKESDLGTNIVKGQYEGYTSEENVAKDSITDTYFALKVFLDREQWEGVPFYLEHGKALAEDKTVITVRFRSSQQCVCKGTYAHEHPNTLTFTISPEQKIALRFWVRKPGHKYEITPEDLTFNRDTSTHRENGIATDAYEEVLYDAICGDQTLFVSNREQMAAWKYITAILDLWETYKPEVYPKESHGPHSPLWDEVRTLLKP